MPIFLFPHRAALCGFIFLITPISQAACILQSIGNGDFGHTDNSTDLSSRQIASINLQCNGDYRVALDGGLSASGLRRLSDGTGHFISYHLWQNSSATQEWGDEGITYSAPILTSTGNNSDTTHPLFGSALTADAMPPGIYTDTVHVTISYAPFGTTDKLETDLLLSFTLTGSCNIDASGIGGFGQWSVGHTDLQAIPLGSVSVVCNTGLVYAIGMDAGLNWDGSNRHMSNGSDSIAYILWSDAGGSSPWGDADLNTIELSYLPTHPAPAVQAIATGTVQNFFVWGDAIISNVPAAGAYWDTVRVTVVWE